MNNIYLTSLDQPPNAGNRCDHDRYSFKIYSTPPHHRQKSDTQRKAINMINSNRKLKVPGTKRHIRSERREAAQKMMSAAVDHWSADYCAIGYMDHKTGEFVSRTVKYLAKKCGLSKSRAKRAFKTLKELGWIRTVRCDVKINGKTHVRYIKTFGKGFAKFIGDEVAESFKDFSMRRRNKILPKYIPENLVEKNLRNLSLEERSNFYKMDRSEAASIWGNILQKTKPPS